MKKKSALHPLGYAQADIEGKRIKAIMGQGPVLAPKPDRKTYAKIQVLLTAPATLDAGFGYGVLVKFPWEKPGIIDHRTRLAALHRVASAIILMTPSTESWAVTVLGENSLAMEPSSGSREEAIRARDIACAAITAIMKSNSDLF